MDAKDNFPGYEKTLPVLSRPAAAWSADPIHSDPYAAPIHPPYADPNPSAIQTAQTSHISTVPPTPSPAPPAPASSRNATSRVRKTRKNAQASAGKSTLFWVNSDQQTAAAGTTDETLKRIRSHVMSEHNRKKRMESTEQYNKSKWKPSPYQAPAMEIGALVPAENTRSSLSSSISLPGGHILEEQEIEEVEGLLTPAAAAGYSALPAASWDGTGFSGAMSYTPGPSAWTCVGQGANDPFNTGHTQLTDRMMRHLRVCKIFYPHSELRNTCILTRS